MYLENSETSCLLFDWKNVGRLYDAKGVFDDTNTTYL